MKKTLVVPFLCLGLSIPIVTWAAFPDADVDGTTSLGRFSIRLTQETGNKWLGIDTCPGDLTDPNDPCVIHSPGLEDHETRIGRSDPHNDDSPTDNNTGAQIACTGTTGCPASGFLPTPVKDDDFTIVPNTGLFKEGPSGTEEVHTQILSFHLVPAKCESSPVDMPPPGWQNFSPSATAVRAGTWAPDQPRSIGEVESLGSGGFPAESFFNVFVEVDIDFDPDGAGPSTPDNIVDITLFNKKPLVIQNGELDKFPPTVVYVHGGSDGAPLVYDKATGEPIGWVTLAGHGINYGCYGIKGPGDFDTVYYNEMVEYTKLEPLPVDETDEPRKTSSGLSPLADTMHLSVEIAGTGGGWVSSEPLGINCQTNHCTTVSYEEDFNGIQCDKNYCASRFETRTWVELTATADSDSVFVAWGGSPDCVDGHLWMTENKSCVAFFSQLHELTVTQAGDGTGNVSSHDFGNRSTGINCGNGHTRCSQRFRNSRTVFLVATPAAGSSFAGWGEDCEGTDSQVKVDINKAKSCSATFLKSD